MSRVKIWMLILGAVLLILGVGIGHMRSLNNIGTMFKLKASGDAQANPQQLTEIMDKTAKVSSIGNMVGLVGLVLIVVSFRMKAK